MWAMRREGLAEVISIREALTNQIAVQNLCHSLHLGMSIVSRSSSCQVGVIKTNYDLMTSARPSALIMQ